MENTVVYKVVLTGGPCAGKTATLNSVVERYSQKGFKVITLSESATELINSGFQWRKDGFSLETFQRAIFEMQLVKEKNCKNIIATAPYEKVLIICDRGLLDMKAYLPTNECMNILKDFNLTEQQILLEYDMVIHLESVAVKYPELFTLKNNTARNSTPTQAAELDRKVKAAWQNHSNFYSFEACETCDERKQNVFNCLDKFISSK